MNNKLEKIEKRKLVPFISINEKEKTNLFNILLEFDYFEYKKRIGTSFINIIRYNPYIKQSYFYPLKIEEINEEYYFYKELKSEIYIENNNKTNNETNNKTNINFNNEDIIYMFETNEIKFINDKDYLLTHDICDVSFGLFKNISKERKKIEYNKQKIKKKEFEEFIVIEDRSKTQRNNNSGETSTKENNSSYNNSTENKIINLKELIKIIKNNTEGGILMINNEKFEENILLFTKTFNFFENEIKKFLIILNTENIYFDKEKHIQKIQNLFETKFQKYNYIINKNNFILLNINQFQNELLMKKSFSHLINYYFYKYYYSIIKNNNSISFIKYLTEIIRNLEKKTKQRINEKISELSASYEISEINEQIINIIKDIKTKYNTEKINFGISEKDIKNSEEEEDNIESNFYINNNIDIDNINNLKPYDIIKIIYILRKEKEIMQISEETKLFINYFRIKIEESKFLLDIIKDISNFCQEFKNDKIENNDVKNLNDEIIKIIDGLKMNDYSIYISILGLQNDGKNFIINEIIGNNMFPIEFNIGMKKCFFIKYSEGENIVIRKSKFRNEKDTTNFYFYEGNIDINELNEANYNCNENENKEDYFYYIETRIKLLDEMNLEKSIKNNIILIYFPEYEKNLYNDNKIIKKFLNICENFVFIVENDRNNIQELIESIYNNKDEKNKSFFQVIKSCLFILNNDLNQSSTGKSDSELKSFIQNIIKGIELDDIYLSYFNFKNYLDYMRKSNYDLYINDIIENEYEIYNYYKFLSYKEPLLHFKKRYKSFLNSFYKNLKGKTQKEFNIDVNNILKNNNINENNAKFFNEKVNEICKSEDLEDLSDYENDINNLLTFLHSKEISSYQYQKYDLEFFKKYLLSEIKYYNLSFPKKFNENIEKVISLFYSIDDTLKKYIKERINNLIKLNNNTIMIIIKDYNNIVISSLNNKKTNLKILLKSKGYEEILKEINQEVLMNLKGFNSEIKNIVKNINLKSKSINEIISFFWKEKNIFDFKKLLDINYEEEIYNEINNKSKEYFDNYNKRKGIFETFKSYFILEDNILVENINLIIDTFSKKIDSIIFNILKNLTDCLFPLLHSNCLDNDLLISEYEKIIKKIYLYKNITKSQNYEDKYYDLKEIGKGGYGKVYKAKVKNTNQFRALKIINKKLLKQSIKKNCLKEEEVEEEYKTYIIYFMNEIDNMKICSRYNTNINSVKFYEYYDTEEEFIIVMELCDDNLLSILTKRKKGFNKEEIYDIIHQLNNTFKIMVKNKIIHRDLKLENILVKYKNKQKTKFIAKLSDYGISKKFMDLTKKTNTIIGSISYMAPEILNDEEYNNECDLWSIGIFIYRLFFIEFPYKAKTESGLLKQINQFGKKILKSTKDKDLDNLIKRLLEKDPRKRMTWEEFFNFFNPS